MHTNVNTLKNKHGFLLITTLMAITEALPQYNGRNFIAERLFFLTQALIIIIMMRA